MNFTVFSVDRQGARHVVTQGEGHPGELWRPVQTAIRRAAAPWHDSLLVAIDRLDGGANYAAPGEYEVVTRDGDKYLVVVAEGVAA